MWLDAPWKKPMIEEGRHADEARDNRRGIPQGSPSHAAAACLECCRRGAAGEQAVVADAVEARRQDVDEESADELGGSECHDLLAITTFAR